MHPYIIILIQSIQYVFMYVCTYVVVTVCLHSITVDPHLSGLHLFGGSDYPDTKFPGIAICTLAIWP